MHAPTRGPVGQARPVAPRFPVRAFLCSRQQHPPPAGDLIIVAPRRSVWGQANAEPAAGGLAPLGCGAITNGQGTRPLRVKIVT
jgi:hypothetical protein